MLRDLFPRTHGHYEGSRFAGDLEAFAEWLRAVGYSRPSAHQHVYRLDQALGHGNGIQPGGTFCEADLHAAFTFRRGSRPDRSTQRAFTRFLAAVGRLKAAEPTDFVDMSCRHYLRHLSEARGLDGATIQQHRSTVADFLARGLPQGRELSAADRRRCRGLCPAPEHGGQAPDAPAHRRASEIVPAVLRRPRRDGTGARPHRYAADLPR